MSPRWGPLLTQTGGVPQGQPDVRYCPHPRCQAELNGAGVTTSVLCPAGAGETGFGEQAGFSTRRRRNLLPAPFDRCPPAAVAH